MMAGFYWKFLAQSLQKMMINTNVIYGGLRLKHPIFIKHVHTLGEM